ncbi:MAG TPA: MgtC/SapB family protein [Candidatus Obscuribacterales bacterium]
MACAALTSTGGTDKYGAAGETRFNMPSIYHGSEMTLGVLATIWSWFSSLFSTPVGQEVLEFLPHLLVALALGALLGWERRHKHKIAGVRTHMVISASACLITLSGVWMAEQSGAGTDPTRLAAQILAGIGFVGAGVILRRGLNTSGITTSATILFAAGIGIASGFGFFGAATAATVLMLASMFITYRLFPSHDTGGHTLKVVCPLVKFDEVKKKFGAGNRVDSLQKLGDRLEFRVHTNLNAQQLDKLLAEMVLDPDIFSVDVIDDNS